MTHLHRGHPCTLAVPHLHYPAWARMGSVLDRWTEFWMLAFWWPQRRPRRAAA